MIRRDAIEIVCQHVKNDIIISANGFISRDLFSSLEKNTNFYMIGSMGLSSSIGLGIALKKPKKRIFVFDGDGNILMNLGSIVTIGSLRPKNLVHIIFDDSIHEYRVFSVKSKKDLEISLKKIQKIKGPILIHIRLSKGTKKSSRVDISPEKIKSRFMSAIN